MFLNNFLQWIWAFFFNAIFLAMWSWRIIGYAKDCWILFGKRSIIVKFFIESNFEVICTSYNDRSTSTFWKFLIKLCKLIDEFMIHRLPKTNWPWSVSTCPHLLVYKLFDLNFICFAKKELRNIQYVTKVLIPWRWI